MQKNTHPSISSPRKLGCSTSRDRQSHSRSATWPCYAPLSPDRVPFPRAGGRPPRERYFSHSEAAPAIRLPHTPFRRDSDLLDLPQQEPEEVDAMVDQEQANRMEETLRWVLNQQRAQPERRRATTMRPQARDEGHAFVRAIQREAEMRKEERRKEEERQEEEERTRMFENTTRQESDRRRVVQEEVRRIQLRIRRNSESTRMDEVRRQAHLRGLREIKNRNIEAWLEYDAKWASIPEGAGPLSFRAIPWPMFAPPQDAGDITTPAVAAFLFSTVHSANQSRRERVRAALLRWHPDRFARILARVADEDRDGVEQSVNAVARCLNELMAHETAATTGPRTSRTHA